MFPTIAGTTREAPNPALERMTAGAVIRGLDVVGSGHRSAWSLDQDTDDLLASERIRLRGVSLEHRLAVGLARCRQFQLSGVRGVVFAVPEARVGDVFAQPWLAGAHCSRQHVSHQAGFSGDDSEVFVDVLHLCVEASGRQVSQSLYVHNGLTSQWSEPPFAPVVFSGA